MNDFKQQVRCTFVGSNQYDGEWVSSNEIYAETFIKKFVSLTNFPKSSPEWIQIPQKNATLTDDEVKILLRAWVCLSSS